MIKDKKQQVPIYLNIYSFSHCFNTLCSSVGIGLYHTAVQIKDVEYMFHGFAGKETGVEQITPFDCPYRFQEQILLGYTSLNPYDLEFQILPILRDKYISKNCAYQGDTYDLFNNNCNHFALDMAETLKVSEGHIKGKIFTVTDCLNNLRCCLPRCILSGRLDWFTQEPQQTKYYEEVHSSQSKNKYNKLYEQEYHQDHYMNHFSLHSSQAEREPTTFHQIVSPTAAATIKALLQNKLYQPQQTKIEDGNNTTDRQIMTKMEIAQVQENKTSKLSIKHEEKVGSKYRKKGEWEEFED